MKKTWNVMLSHHSVENGETTSLIAEDWTLQGDALVFFNKTPANGNEVMVFNFNSVVLFYSDDE